MKNEIIELFQRFGKSRNVDVVTFGGHTIQLKSKTDSVFFFIDHDCVERDEAAIEAALRHVNFIFDDEVCK